MKIVFLAGKGDSTTFMYNALKSDFNIAKLLIEESVPSKQIIKRRIKRLGLFKVINQLLFQGFISKGLKLISKKRISDLKKIYKLSSEEIPEDKIVNIPSVNDDVCLEALKKLNPDVVIVNGTRIISKRILQSIDGIFINTHVGITPQYRGVHGGYWALVKGDKENCGVTIHLVDPGIDTGSILKQATVFPGKKDNFVTYPYHQYGIAAKMMEEVLLNIEKKELNPFKKVNAESNLYYHPTFTGYLYHYFFKGVK
jgi:folate-dependent phosphoribosylglycinamide formyltransferase PurN